ncbi:glycogen debranching N-terminal domain-containing protein [Azotobacter vinelandii]
MTQGMTREPALAELDIEEVLERTPQRLLVLKESDTFLVADVYGDVTGDADGLFHDDTRLLSIFRLRFSGQKPSLLSGMVSGDNVFFTAHMTNHPLSPLESAATPQGRHPHRAQALLVGRPDLRAHLPVQLWRPADAGPPLTLQFAADFHDMFEVRGEKRPRRGQHHPAQLGERTVQLSYTGLDQRWREVRIELSETPERLDEGCAEFLVDIREHASWVLHVEIGGGPAAQP